ncbi:hypothetical protein [Nonomuraea roseoviolacea]|uniref:Uncharacterized protein n=1 Tax=Nonomuraea roseoviolacea subsp. carminata TaxID=160689 RepID=A0ABT1K9H9_9ACTN|nr:hypothetical protein [Nonomuraea roseoviolacea]MCP2350672.1 hypothetical protein [Nonomuraea roseoviolacea subsp. carminata]
MSTFTPFNGLPSEDEISEYLASLGDPHQHPYDAFPAQARPRPTWRGGPRLSRADERAYRDEQDDQ